VFERRLVDDSATDSTQLVRAADEALYEVKSAGKGAARMRFL